MPAFCRDIEEMLTRRPDVADAMVVDYAAPGPVLVLVAPREFCSGPEIRDECASSLGGAAYRVTVALVTEVPRVPGEFPDAAAVLAGASGVFRYEPPRSHTEQQMAALWNEVLGRARTGMLDDFLDLGGDSVRAVRLVARIEEELGAAIDLASFFGAPSVRAVVGLVEAARAASGQAVAGG